MKTDPVTFEPMKDPDPALTAMENALRHTESNLDLLNRKVSGLESELDGAKKIQRAYAFEVKHLRKSIKIWKGDGL